MTRVRLTKLQAALLASLADRDTGSAGACDQLRDQGKAEAKAIAQLLKRGLITKSACETKGQAWHTEGNQKYRLAITHDGCAAIGSDDQPSVLQDVLEGPKIQPTCTGYTGSPPPLTKTKMVIDLLWREQGATIGELLSATGWLPHTTRAALTGLRKKGHVIAKGKRDDEACYTIVEAQI